MKFPIIELRQENLWVRLDFDGIFIDSTVRTRRNLANNKTRYVVDSNGDLWSFAFVRTDHHGIRKIVSTLWNISSDYYTFAQETDISVERFRNLIEPLQRNIDPDQQEMAMSLWEPIAACDSSDRLRSHIHLLNL
jgi:hypothetical protein